MKTIIAPGLKARMLGLAGWFSTNILGNRDGEVLDDPGSFRTKEVSKTSVLDAILQPEMYGELYGDYFHKVRIEYYPPRGDAKEGWDNIDIVGWLGQPMQIKLNFLCRDSILAAPVALDLILFLDLAQRAGLAGIQEWLSFYFKSPMSRPDLKPEHDLFIQHLKLSNTLRILVGEEVINHSGLDYYEGGAELGASAAPRGRLRRVAGGDRLDAELLGQVLHIRRPAGHAAALLVPRFRDGSQLPLQRIGPHAQRGERALGVLGLPGRVGGGGRAPETPAVTDRLQARFDDLDHASPLRALDEQCAIGTERDRAPRFHGGR